MPRVLDAVVRRSAAEGDGDVGAVDDLLLEAHDAAVDLGLTTPISACRPPTTTPTTMTGTTDLVALRATYCY